VYCRSSSVLLLLSAKSGGDRACLAYIPRHCFGARLRQGADYG
jgi:hypothetical protein